MFAMKRLETKPSSPSLIVTSTLGTTLVSVVVAWFAISLSAPIVGREDIPSATQSNPYKSPSRNLYRLSPIPAGADWTA
jgi:hypothetical protein